ncbi:MAG: hypothetical protein ACOC0R_05930 [Mariniphaga sp.]
MVENTHKSGTVILYRVLGIFLLFGGLVRIFAGRKLFELAGIGGLWSEQNYFQYIYRTLGGFVLLTGLSFVAASSRYHLNRKFISAWAAGFIIIAAVMLFAAINYDIPLLFTIPDILFCLATAIILLLTNTRPPVI